MIVIGVVAVLGLFLWASWDYDEYQDRQDPSPYKDEDDEN